VELYAACLLLAYGIGMTLAAAPLMRYTDATAAQLLQPSEYVQQLRATTPEIRQP
jgi:multicomponent K+:H+ antiporter subunit D